MTAVALARAVVVLTILAGVGFSIQGVIQLEKDTPADARRSAWSSSEDDRMRSVLVWWYPIVDGVRRNTPQRAVIWLWTGYPAPGPVLFDSLDLLRAMFAPRLSLPAVSPEFMAEWQSRLSSGGHPIYFLEIHPSSLPQVSESRPAPVPLHEWTVVERHPDFTLRRLDRAR